MSTEFAALLENLKQRFDTHPERHYSVSWKTIEDHLNSSILQKLNWMEETGGEPDVVILGNDLTLISFVDCSKESPAGRRSCCYDEQARLARKANAPNTSARGMADNIDISLLNVDEYQQLQQLMELDLKTSSWLETPSDIRKLGGALFGDRRYNQVFTYHNGADSYYAARGFRCKLTIQIN